MRINHNISALNTYRQLTANQMLGNKSLEKLSSGLRINRAGDDAAGLAISEKMRGQIRGLDQASRNAQDAISLIQTAEGALNETHSILQRMRELAIQSANDTNTGTDRVEIQKEIDQLAIELTRISNDTEFNTQKLLNGGLDENGIGENSFQIGSNARQSLSVGIGAMDAFTLGVSRDILEGTVAEGAEGVSGVSIDSITKGAAIVNGASLSLTVNDTAAKTSWAAGDTGLTGMTIESTDNSSVYNDYTITINKAGDEGAAPAVSVDGKSITITLADNASSVDATALNTAFENAGLALAASNDASAVAVKTDVGASSAGLADNEVKLTLNGEEVIVKNDVTSVTFDSAEHKGLTINFEGELDGAVEATINISDDKAVAATFSGGEKTGDAVTKAGVDVSSKEKADLAVDDIQRAIETVSAERSKLGAFQNRLEHTINNLGTSAENLTAAESRIRDVDMAADIMEFTKMSILQQAATAMLAQANQQPQMVLQLLG